MGTHLCPPGALNCIGDLDAVPWGYGDTFVSAQGVGDGDTVPWGHGDMFVSPGGAHRAGGELLLGEELGQHGRQGRVLWGQGDS